MVDNKRIAKNTFFLYFRMLFLMCISLYTSRIVLHTLGVTDFGIYNIVGSVVVMFSFISNALVNTTKRFINFDLGKKETSELRKTFSLVFSIHVLICVIIVILLESIGVWYLNYKLNVPPDRIIAANWVFQFSVISACIGIVGSPFEATIIAYEKMSIYSYISIVEGVAKLLIVYLLTIVDFDRLIFYAALILIISISINFYKWFYCKKKFKIIQFKLIWDKEKFLSIISFSGWSLFGQLAYIASSTGLNLIANYFIGVIINATIGIAQQVNGAINKFVGGFQTAFSPQLIQTYSSNHLADHRKLINRASRISFFLIYFLSLPILCNTDYILNLWLIEVPEKSAIIIRLIIISSMIEAVVTPLWMSMQAIGNIKKYQLTISSLNILNVPISFALLYIGFQVEIMFIVNIFLATIMFLYRMIYILPKVNYNIKCFFLDVLVPIAKIITLTCISIYPIYQILLKSSLNNHCIHIILILSTLIITLIAIVIFGLTKNEKTLVYKKIARK